MTYTIPELSVEFEFVDSPVKLTDSGTLSLSNSANPISWASPLAGLPSRPHNKLMESVSDVESSPSISCSIVEFGLLHGKTVRSRHTDNKLLNSGTEDTGNTA